MLNYVEDNEARVVGCVNSYLEFSHEVHGERFYIFQVKVNRLSDNHDLLTVTVSERILSDLELHVGDKVEITGQFRSYNNYTDQGNRLVLTLFAKDICPPDAVTADANEIYLNGFLCKSPIYRTTPFGREIADLLLAVNRAYSKSDYIPCIAWGRNARYVKNLAVGQNVKIWGRMQSREYQKKLSEEETVTKTAYEVSISKLIAVDAQAETETPMSEVNH